jgi:hypothetical protein
MHQTSQRRSFAFRGRQRSRRIAETARIEPESWRKNPL